MLQEKLANTANTNAPPQDFIIFKMKTKLAKLRRTLPTLNMYKGNQSIELQLI